jgi:hypothetical protein
MVIAKGFLAFLNQKTLGGGHTFSSISHPKNT